MTGLLGWTTIGPSSREGVLEQATPKARVPIWGLRATPRLVFRVLGRAASNFADDRGTQMAAAISYYTLFSLFPLTLLAVSIFGVVLRSPEVQGRVLNAIIAFLPIQDESIAESLRSVADLGPTLTIVSLLGSLWSGGAVSASI
ncbi:MAG: YhjD/YihY/BrkB family envelope integrity protein, partial [Dehalococcoidia bacterium]